MAKIIRNKATYDHTKQRGEKFKGKSMTVPDESYTVHQLFQRFTNGISPAVQKDGQYHDGDHDSYDLEKVAVDDIIDRMDAIDNLRAIAENAAKAARKISADEKAAKQKLDQEWSQLRSLLQPGAAAPASKPAKEGGT